MATRDAMQSLVDWYGHETQVHPLVKCALFCYEFVTIHPFQDGNGRLSKELGYPAPTVKRVLTELVNKKLLVKHGVGPGTNYTAT